MQATLRKVNGRQRHKGTYIKSQNKVHTVGRKKLVKQIYIFLTHIQVRENLCQSDCHTICKEITIILCVIVLPATIYTVVFLGEKGISIKIYYIKV